MFFYLMWLSVLFLFFYMCLFTAWSTLSFPFFFVIHSFFPYLFTCLCLEFYLSFSLVLVFFPKTSAPLPLSVSLSLCITKVCPAESAVWLGLPGHPGFNGGRVEFDGQPVRLYLPLLRAAPQAQQAQHRQEGQYNQSHDSLPPFHTSRGFYSPPKCRAAQTLMRKWKLQRSRSCCNFWLLKSPERFADTLAFSY